MRTLDELLYYCEEPEPVGAILLTGEWGCGCKKGSKGKR